MPASALRWYTPAEALTGSVMILNAFEKSRASGRHPVRG